MKYPQWQALLQEIVIEFDREALANKIQKAEAVIFERLQQLSPEIIADGEREAINNALSILRIIKRDRLGYPDLQ
ncbi:MAG TPA: hypothetical protein VKQ28_12510 [Candidatus Acidoferrum sp.]|nr:hypothetical protein [Candidatus Acidoferrum sp.]